MTTTTVGKEAAPLNMDNPVGQASATDPGASSDDQLPKAFDYRQFSKAMNRSRYLDDLARGAGAK